MEFTVHRSTNSSRAIRVEWRPAADGLPAEAVHVGAVTRDGGEWSPPMLHLGNGGQYTADEFAQMANAVREAFAAYARTFRDEVGVERCIKCRRVRPEHIADPTCARGGYCAWSCLLGDLVDVGAREP